MKKAHIHSESRELVLAGLDLLGINTQTISDCGQLTDEIRYRTGQSLSPSTIYRMLNSEEQGVNASLRSTQILKSLIERLQNDFIQPLPSIRFTRIHDKDRQRLQELISRLFWSESNELKKWFTDLPLEYGSLGWEQILIGKSLGQALRAHKAPLDSPWICDLIKTPQFTLYYTKTMGT